MTTELAWTRELPTKPGLYAWRVGWAGLEPHDGGLFIIYERDGELRICRPDGTHDEPIATSAMAGEEWLGPLPE